MCGLTGWYNRNGADVDVSRLLQMAQTIVHRGPDDGGHWCQGAIGLAHRRLSIRDLSVSGRQPMADVSGRVVVAYNGEIYNDVELRRELERDFGVVFRTRTDTEILPYGYLAWGDALFEKLEGLYAIALWDCRNGRLLLARDGIGIKPLHFCETSDAVVFGSEIKAVLASGMARRDIDEGSLHTFLAAGHAGPATTLLKGIKQVPPGSVVAFTASQRQQWQFWRPKRSPQITDVNLALAELEQTLGTVVESQLVSDVPVSVFQSGGIDSSLISLTLGRRGLKAPLFTAGFDEKSHDETDTARDIATAAGLEQRIVSTDMSGEMDAIFRASVHHFDGQCSDTGALAFYQLSHAVKKHSTVVLSGDGGDEFFCGYQTYAATRLAEIGRSFVPAPLAGVVGRAAYRLSARNESRLPMSSLAARFGLGLSEGRSAPHLFWRRLVPQFIAEDLYGPALADLASESPYGEYSAYYWEGEGTLLDRAMIADQRFHLQSVLTKVDAMSMAHGLEVRVPLLDRRIMDLAGRIDVSLLNPAPLGPPKLILRQLARRLGMPATAAASKKKGFNVPNARLLRGELAPLADQVLDRDADVLAPYLLPEQVRQLWRAHKDRRADNAFALWPVLTVGTWLAQLARPQTAPPTAVSHDMQDKIQMHSAGAISRV
jgi:asparagine synthase (glutamine-hydrolysing)